VGDLVRRHRLRQAHFGALETDSMGFPTEMPGSAAGVLRKGHTSSLRSRSEGRPQVLSPTIDRRARRATHCSVTAGSSTAPCTRSRATWSLELRWGKTAV